LANDFHLEDLVGVPVGFGLGVSQKCDDPVLKGAEAAFDFAFGLGSGRDDVATPSPRRAR